MGRRAPRALAARIGVQLALLEHATPPQAVACLKSGARDLLFLPLVIERREAKRTRCATAGFRSAM